MWKRGSSRLGRHGGNFVPVWCMCRRQVDVWSKRAVCGTLASTTAPFVPNLSTRGYFVTSVAADDVCSNAVETSILFQERVSRNVHYGHDACDVQPRLLL